MAAVGVGAKGKRQQRRGSLHAPRRGCSRPSCVGCGDGPHGVVAGVVAATQRRAVKEEKKNRIWVKGGDMAQCIYTSNEVARLVAHFPMPWINPPSNTFFVKVLVTCAPMHIQRNTVLTLLQVLPLPLLQTCHGTTLHRSHPPTSDATALITTSCILFYFISPFLLLKSSSRSHYHTRRRCMGTTATAHARGMTTQSRPRVRKPPCRRRILL